eukprot:4310082-Amphidinium_carterae.1
MSAKPDASCHITASAGDYDIEQTTVACVGHSQALPWVFTLLSDCEARVHPGRGPASEGMESPFPMGRCLHQEEELLQVDK